MAATKTQLDSGELAARSFGDLSAISTPHASALGMPSAGIAWLSIWPHTTLTA
jgi:hypothetical protein